jgi:RNA polymerase sigma factor (sigma-70 family)
MWQSADGPAADAFEPTFLELYQTHFAEMVRLAVLLLDSDVFAEDLVHDAFIRVQSHWHTIDRPHAYLRRTVVNACRSSHRRLLRERRAARFASTPVYDLEADELLDALAKLPYRQRAAVTLRYYEQLTYAEIADAMDCPEGTAASLLRRGMAQLRRTIDR